MLKNCHIRPKKIIQFGPYKDKFISYPRQLGKKKKVRMHLNEVQVLKYQNAQSVPAFNSSCNVTINQDFPKNTLKN